GSPWRVADLKPALQRAARAADIGGRALYQPVRVALTGQLHGPDLAETAYALGRRRTLERVDRAARIASRSPDEAGAP
ncbi:MAG: hypothetical protein R3266_08660, partial [Gemmatimonadota bacterium]|nr:hypothetical protein [Gemmatimonadota bacterium]